MERIKLSDEILIINADAAELDCLGLSAEVAEELIAVFLPGIVASGFARTEDKLFCDIFVTARGDCQLIFTRYAGAAKGAEDRMRYISDEDNTERERFIYEFSDLETLLGACREMSRSMERIVSSAVYDEYTGKFYLSTNRQSPIPGEFSAEDKTGEALPIIGERCSLVSENAVAFLASFAR